MCRVFLRLSLSLSLCVLIRFSELVANYAQEIRKVELRRNVAGWNVCQFYCIKEGLAFTYERAGLLREVRVSVSVFFFLLCF